MAGGDTTHLTRRSFGTLGIAAAISPALSLAARAAPAHRYRPQIHFAPAKGFMNDPNGLIRYDGEYHLFFQHNPTDTRAGNVHWGHAVSTDLLHWRELPIAIAPDAAGLPFSGSAVFDRDNSSGLFPDERGGMVAVYTRHSDTRQVQEIAASVDRGRSFRPFPGNPVLDIGSPSFRDPRVFRHEPSGRWIMAVARSREHRIAFYGSSDLKRWRELGSFDHAGLLGTDYECPDLVELPVDGGGTRWVLFVSINPGAPLGGSAVQYFVGSFDGKRFVPDDAATRLVDAGPDFYAMQSFADAGTPPVAIAWMSNWLYCNDVPANPSRGAMTLPRRLSLRRRADGWTLVQAPVPLDAIAGRTLLSGERPAKTGVIATAALPSGEAIEIIARIAPQRGARLTFALRNRGGEALVTLVDAGNYPAFSIDRSATRGFRHRYMTDRAIWAAPPDTLATDIRLIVDRSSIELVGHGGEGAVTMLHYFDAAPDRLEIVAENGAVALGGLTVRTLRATMP